jgi:type IV pilus assembly protein PilW
MKVLNRIPGGTRRAQAGLSLVELLIAVTLGLILMSALAAIFASNSAARTELERNARQIENGRYAMEVLSEDLRLAGFYGEQPISPVPLTTGGPAPDPCALTPAEWRDAMPVAVQHYDGGVGVPFCIDAVRVPGTDVIVIRRASTCEAGFEDCPVAVNGKPYIQVAKCATETAVAAPALPYVFDRMGATPFNLHLRDCNTPARMRRYLIRAYYVAPDNGNGVAIPTLMRKEFNGSGWDTQPMVEGIEYLNVEYGIDITGTAITAGPDGEADAFSADPVNFVNATCSGACALSSITTARVTVLARNLEASAGYTDTKTYNVGRDNMGLETLVTPGGAYRRHVYSGVVRVVNVAERREKPL